MSEPFLFGIPLSRMFLYFVWYSLLGWLMESCYCSFRQKRWINRGFLHMTLCPIYGVGVLIMVNFFTPFVNNVFVFYLMATVVMSAWEYLVGWLLEVTTHTKYWDYSDRKFNLHGRIYLFYSLWWGIAAYLAIFWIHPATVRLFDHLTTPVQQILAAVLAAAVGIDTALTIRQLALLRKAIDMAEEARLQLELGRAELRQALDDKREELRDTLADRREALRDTLTDKREELRDTLTDKREELRQTLDDRHEALDGRREAIRSHAEHARMQAELAAMEVREHKLIADVLDRSARFRSHYSLHVPKYPKLLRELREHLKERRNKD